MECDPPGEPLGLPICTEPLVSIQLMGAPKPDLGIAPGEGSHGLEQGGVEGRIVVEEPEGLGSSLKRGLGAQVASGPEPRIAMSGKDFDGRMGILQSLGQARIRAMIHHDHAMRSRFDSGQGLEASARHSRIAVMHQNHRHRRRGGGL